MAREAECPICNANIPLDDDIMPGQHVWCSYCSAQLMVTREMLEEDEDDVKKYEVEEDWEG